MRGHIFIVQKLQVQELISLSGCQQLLPTSEKTHLSLVINQHADRPATATACEGSFAPTPPLSTNNLQQHIWGHVLCALDLEWELSWLSHCIYKYWNECPITHILAGGRQLISILHFLCPWRRMRHCIKLFGFFCFLHRPAQPITQLSVCKTQQPSPKQRTNCCQTSNRYLLINSHLVWVAKEPVLNLTPN